jgi:hypothetical protein
LLSYKRLLVLASPELAQELPLHLLSRPRRPLRPGEWTPAKAVTFIVTLAATRSVTLRRVKQA